MGELLLIVLPVLAVFGAWIVWDELEERADRRAFEKWRQSRKSDHHNVGE